MSFFERYFAALDGPDPLSSLEMVSEDVEFVIFWGVSIERSRQIVGGREDLRAFVEVGDMAGWAHHVLWSASQGGVEFAQGETRSDAGERIGTFLCSAQLDARGRMVRYLVARSPVIAFNPDGDTH